MKRYLILFTKDVPRMQEKMNWLADGGYGLHTFVTIAQDEEVLLVAVMEFEMEVPRHG